MNRSTRVIVWTIATFASASHAEIISTFDMSQVDSSFSTQPPVETVPPLTGGTIDGVRDSIAGSSIDASPAYEQTYDQAMSTNVMDLPSGSDYSPVQNVLQNDLNNYEAFSSGQPDFGNSMLQQQLTWELEAAQKEQDTWRQDPGYVYAEERQWHLPEEKRQYDEWMATNAQLQTAKAAHRDDVIIGNAFNRGRGLDRAESKELSKMGYLNTSLAGYQWATSATAMREKAQTLSGAISVVNTIHSGSTNLIGKAINGYDTDGVKDDLQEDARKGLIESTAGKDASDQFGAASDAVSTVQNLSSIYAGKPTFGGPVSAVVGASMDNMENNLNNAVAANKQKQDRLQQIGNGQPKPTFTDIMPGAPLTWHNTEAGKRYLADGPASTLENRYQVLKAAELGARAKQIEAFERRRPSDPSGRNYVEEYKEFYRSMHGGRDPQPVRK